MNKKAYFATAKELAEYGSDNIPKELLSGEHLIYSSPATLAYNSPGAQGFGVKRAALVIPESVMLLVSPASCGRNTTILADEGGYSDRMFFLQMSDNDIVTGRHLSDIPQAVKEIYEVCEKKPKVVVICITCVDALLGTDLERVCRKAEEYSGVHVVPSYMYALTREGKNPPMIAIREAIYSLLKPLPKRLDSVNLLGYFSPLAPDCELIDLLAQIGITHTNQVSQCQTLEEYYRMGAANFNLILNPEARKAAFGLEERLHIPYAELTRLYELDRIKKQYGLFAAALGTKFDDDMYYQEAKEATERLYAACWDKTFAIGEVLNANPIEMALALTKLHLKVKSIFASVSSEDYPFIKELATANPDIKIYSTLSPSMMNWSRDDTVDISIGLDAAYYFPDSINVAWNSEVQPFGYRGLVRFVEAVEEELS